MSHKETFYMGVANDADTTNPELLKTIAEAFAQSAERHKLKPIGDLTFEEKDGKRRAKQEFESITQPVVEPNSRLG